VESALGHIDLLESLGFRDIVVSLKASDVPQTIEAYRLMARRTTCPLHVGVTAAGSSLSGIVRSAVGIGSLLAEGIGDTIRVSLTGDPKEEVRVAWHILRALDLRTRGATIVSCPTCGRCEIDLVRIARGAERLLRNRQKPLTVAVMGCPVNGPGEAREADIGIAGGRGVGLIFRGGKVIRKVKEKDLLQALMEEAEALNMP
jgi:(E)-4-hydroxy-3-methylbut-2-enyl-diphosphate synthase